MQYTFRLELTAPIDEKDRKVLKEIIKTSKVLAKAINYIVNDNILSTKNSVETRFKLTAVSALSRVCKKQRKTTCSTKSN